MRIVQKDQVKVSVPFGNRFVGVVLHSEAELRKFDLSTGHPQQVSGLTRSKVYERGFSAARISQSLREIKCGIVQSKELKWWWAGAKAGDLGDNGYMAMSLGKFGA